MEERITMEIMMMVMVMVMTMMAAMMQHCVPELTGWPPLSLHICLKSFIATCISEALTTEDIGVKRY